MRQVLDVNILEDAAVQKTVALGSIPGAVLGLILLGVGMGHVVREASWGEAFLWLGWAAVLYVVSLPLHELVHAAFFKLFGPAGTRVVFGFASGMLYAGCPGVFLKRGQFVATLVAPFVVLSLAYLVLGVALHAPLLAGCLFCLHASGCAGDFYLTWAIARHPEADLCEDTKTGVALWRSEG